MNHFEKFQEALEIEQKSENTFTLIPNTNYFVGNTFLNNIRNIDNKISTISNNLQQY